MTPEDKEALKTLEDMYHNCRPYGSDIYDECYHKLREYILSRKKKNDE
jgi:hypothetical protein